MALYVDGKRVEPLQREFGSSTVTVRYVDTCETREVSLAEITTDGDERERQAALRRIRTR